MVALGALLVGIAAMVTALATLVSTMRGRRDNKEILAQTSKIHFLVNSNMQQLLSEVSRLQKILNDKK